MRGLLRRVAGGALAGLGQGIVQNAAAIRQETLERMRQSAADRRAQADRDSRAEQARLDREARATEGAATRATQKEIAGIRADATTGAARTRAAAAHEQWLNKPVKVGETLGTDGTSTYVYKTNRELLADLKQGKIDDARNALRDEIAATAEDQSSVFNWFSSKDNATDADIEKAFSIREKNPDLTAAQALDQAMGGRFLGKYGHGARAQPGSTGSTRPPGVPSNAVQAAPGTRGAGRWYVPDGKGGWIDVTPKK